MILMQISCPQCNSLYQLQAQALGMGVLKSLHCTICDHSFVARRTRRSTAAFAVRSTAADEPVPVDSMDQLKRMVYTGEITETWEVKGEAGKWHALNRMAELEALFIVCSSSSKVADTVTTTQKKADPPEKQSGSLLKWGVALVLLAAAAAAALLLL